MLVMRAIFRICGNESQPLRSTTSQKAGYPLACINTVEMVQRKAARWVLNRFDRKDSVTLFQP